VDSWQEKSPEFLRKSLTNDPEKGPARLPAKPSAFREALDLGCTHQQVDQQGDPTIQSQPTAATKEATRVAEPHRAAPPMTPQPSSSKAVDSKANLSLAVSKPRHSKAALDSALETETCSW
jgi:hypothetical protein